MRRYIQNLVIYIALMLVVTACNNPKYCIDADDFGFAKFPVNAAGQKVVGQGANQYSQWTDSNLVLNGDPLLIIVRGQGYVDRSVTPNVPLTPPSCSGGSNDPMDCREGWASWFCSNETSVCNFVLSNPVGSQTCVPCTIATCANNSPPSNGSTPLWCPPADLKTDPVTGQIVLIEKYGPVANAPCIFRQGVGLYGLVSPPGNSPSDPNTNQFTIIDPNANGFTTFHMGDQLNLQNGDLTGLGGYSSSADTNHLVDVTALNGGPLYFKILDNFYQDNSGSYNLIVKTGAGNPSPGPIGSVIMSVQKMLMNVSEGIFKRTVYPKNPDGSVNQNGVNYLRDLRLLLTLFIIVSAIGFIMGVVQITQKEIMSMLFKLLVTIQLLANPNSWDFFNNYFFRFFTDGLNQMIAIITSGLSYGIAAGAGGMTFFDNVISMFFGAEVTAKILSLFSANFGVGLFAIPVIYIAIFFFLFSLIKAVIGYLLSLIFMSLLIIIAPIFLTFVLFKMTRHLFDAWLKQLIRFFLEPLIIFAALGLIAVIIIDQLQRMLGFPVCWDPLIQFPLMGYDVTLLDFWNPHIDASKSGIIDLPGFQMVTSTGSPITPAAGYSSVPAVGELCMPYQCSALRHYDLPFLDPINDAEMIQAYSKGGPGWHELSTQSCILLMMTFLMMKFNDTVPDIAKGLVGAVSSELNVMSTAKGLTNAAVAPFKQAASKAAGAATTAARKAISAAGHEVNEQLMKSKTLKSMSDKLSKGYSTAKKGFNSYQDGIGGSIDKAGKPFSMMKEKYNNAIETGKKTNLTDMAGHAVFDAASKRMGGKGLNELQDNFGKSVLGGQSMHQRAEQLQQALHDKSGGFLPGSFDHKAEQANDYQKILMQHATEMAHEHLKQHNQKHSDLKPKEFEELVKNKADDLHAEVNKGNK